MPEELARASAVDKRFGSIVAVRAATASFRSGEVHAVCGENGAGKSTLLKLVAGLLTPNSGEIHVRGARLEPHTPREAIRRGVGMVLQHFALIDVFTALENVVLGAEPMSRWGTLDLSEARAKVSRITGELGVVLPLDARVETLGVGDRQRLEIARALFRDASLLILDEPTAVLTKTEAFALYATLRRLAAQGKGVVVVTHKMDEVREFADAVTVMRHGDVVFTRAIDRSGDVRSQVDDVTAAIMGTSVAQASPNKSAWADSAAPTVLTMHDVRLGRALDGISLDLRRGEIVGVAGVEGNGQREIVQVLAGDVLPDAGMVAGERVAVVREDRQAEGLVLDATLRDNLVLGELSRFGRLFGLLDRRALDAEAGARFARSGADGDLDRVARTLSGGNQQKIVVARALARMGEGRAAVLVVSQPTRGVDIAAAREIHARLRQAAADGAAVIVLSPDLDELRSLAERIVILARGRFVAEVSPMASDEEIGRQMLGIERAPVRAAEDAP